MTRTNLILFAALLLSSVYLVRVSYESRRLFAELDKARSEERALESEHERLKAERQAQATPLRVEKTARERLAMRTASPAVTQYVTDASASPAPAAAPAAAPKPAAASAAAPTTVRPGAGNASGGVR